MNSFSRIGSKKVKKDESGITDFGIYETVVNQKAEQAHYVSNLFNKINQEYAAELI